MHRRIPGKCGSVCTGGGSSMGPGTPRSKSEHTSKRATLRPKVMHLDTHLCCSPPRRYRLPSRQLRLYAGKWPWISLCAGLSGTPQSNSAIVAHLLSTPRGETTTFEKSLLESLHQKEQHASDFPVSLHTTLEGTPFAPLSLLVPTRNKEKTTN